MLHTMSNSFARYEAKLTFDDAKRQNMTLLLNLKLGMTQINPEEDADAGQYHDYGPDADKGRMRDITKWEGPAWSAWKTKFAGDVEKFWSGAFALENKDSYFLISAADGQIYAPNIECKLRLTISDGKAGTNHHNIEVVRLAETESFFGSHSRLYDSKDTNSVTKGYDSDGKAIVQKAHVHEIGHLLGLDHVSVGSTNCPVGSNTNKTICYGVTDFEKNSVMGVGMKVRKPNAKPWIDAMKHFSSAVVHAKVSLAHQDELPRFVGKCSVAPWPASFISLAPKKVSI